ncbi:hypothetical protein CHS0354_009283 [Potamilus streckersoni]|uniref:Uncharacterized protein n=1 Tax=Potamilus streckersoni TaxID=2493646 RepID=A0AAE0T6I8_9BIVA|nr:hypothetical protein CHS0354_009283 [Potamilus streckersoni]
MGLKSKMNDVKKDVFSDIVNRKVSEIYQIRRNSAPASVFFKRGEERKNINESQETNRETLLLCGKILRTIGDEQTSKTFGKNLRNMGDAMYRRYTMDPSLAREENERRDMNQNLDFPITLMDRRPSSR